MENTNVEKGKTEGSGTPPEVMMNETQPDQRHADAKKGDDEKQGQKPEVQVTSPKEYTKKEGQAGQDNSASV